MAAQSVIYNPLIKKGFQEIADISSIESALNELQNQVSAIQSNITALQTAAQNLQNKKVTKCFNAADLANLADGEIFTWHGATTSDPAELTQGYFYTKSVGQQVLPSGTTYFLYDTNYPTITQNGYVFAPGNYYHLNTITPANGSNFFNYALYQWDGITRYYFILAWGVNLQVGDLVWDNQEYTFVTVVSIDELNRPTLSNGDFITATGKAGGNFVEIIETKNADGTAYSFIRTNMGRILVHYTLVNNVFTLIDWFFVYVVTRTTTTPESIGVDTYTRTDTQPKLENVANGTGGVLNITTDTNIAGNLTVSGTTSTVHAQEIESEADYIEMRNGNPLGLANNERSGLEVNNYDGNGTDCVLAVDNAGWARVGDKNGSLQKLATIEENPTDGSFVQYDETAKELKTAAIPEATTTAAGLMSAADKVYLNLSYRNGDGNDPMTLVFINSIFEDIINNNLNNKCFICTIVTNGSYCCGIGCVNVFNGKKYGSLLINGYYFSRIALIEADVINVYEYTKTLIIS